MEAGINLRNGTADPRIFSPRLHGRRILSPVREFFCRHKGNRLKAELRTEGRMTGGKMPPDTSRGTRDATIGSERRARSDAPYLA